MNANGDDPNIVRISTSASTKTNKNDGEDHGNV